MKVVSTKQSVPVAYQDIKPSHCFFRDGNCYMKLKDSCYSARLSTGDMRSFQATDDVFPLPDATFYAYGKE